MINCNFPVLNYFFNSTEEAEKPADLSQRIVFKVKKKEKSEKPEAQDQPENFSESSKKSEKSRRKKEKPTKSLLSFEDEDEG